MREHPAHVVHAWIGHTAAVARSHYLYATDEDFDRAATGAASNPAHYPAHSPAVSNHPTPSGLHETREKTRVGRRAAKKQVPSTGIEKVSQVAAKATTSALPGTLPGTLPDAGDDSAELVRVLAGLTPEERSVLIEAARHASRNR